MMSDRIRLIETLSCLTSASHFLSSPSTCGTTCALYVCAWRPSHSIGFVSTEFRRANLARRSAMPCAKSPSSPVISAFAWSVATTRPAICFGPPHERFGHARPGSRACARAPIGARPDGGQCARAALPADGALHLALRVGLGKRLALVVLALAAAEPDLDLGVVAREVHAQRDQRVAALADLADQARDLLRVQQQLARPPRLVVDVAALRVGADVDVLQPRLAPVDAHVAVGQVGPAGPERLHLGAGQHQARLVALVDEVVVEGAAVDRDVLLPLLRHAAPPASAGQSGGGRAAAHPPAGTSPGPPPPP